MTPNDLTVRLSLQDKLTTPDGGGGATESWTTVADLWADIRPGSASEVLSALALTARVTHRVVVRRPGPSDPQPRSDRRFVLGARTFNIRAVIDDGRDPYLTCLCEEGAPT